MEAIRAQQSTLKLQANKLASGQSVSKKKHVSIIKCDFLILSKGMQGAPSGSQHLEILGLVKDPEG